VCVRERETARARAYTYARTQKQTNTHTNTQTHKLTNTQTHKHTNTQTHKHTDTQTHTHEHTHSTSSRMGAFIRRKRFWEKKKEQRDHTDTVWEEGETPWWFWPHSTQQRSEWQHWSQLEQLQAESQAMLASAALPPDTKGLGFT
jgi:hypothetical protein